ncbi:MAG TPA: DUF4492 domain-containing protein [Prolixibacteraceae bacterium]|nr:DUF4492 domain-containing protein [Prolixibacteraceae bacterium]
MNIAKRVFRFYYDGFKNMTWGKSVWIVILVKLFIFFVIMKLIFFPNFLKKNFDTDAERGSHVLENITNSK